MAWGCRQAGMTQAADQTKAVLQVHTVILGGKVQVGGGPIPPPLSAVLQHSNQYFAFLSCLFRIKWLLII